MCECKKNKLNFMINKKIIIALPVFHSVLPVGKYVHRDTRGMHNQGLVGCDGGGRNLEVTQLDAGRRGEERARLERRAMVWEKGG